MRYHLFHSTLPTILFLSVLMTTDMSAQSNQLNIYSPYGLEFKLWLDGDCKSDGHTQVIRLTDLDKDRYNLRIEFRDKKTEEFKGTIYLTENGLHAANREFSYSIIPYMGTGNVLQLVSITPVGYGNGYSNIPVGQPHYPGQVPVYPGSYPVYPGAGAGYPVQAGSYGYPIMRPEEFDRAKRQIRFKALDDDRLLVAQQVASANYLYTDQVCAIMKIFTYDSTKLAFAKFAYDRAIDKGNYYQVNDAFSHRATGDQLKAYLLARYAGN